LLVAGIMITKPGSLNDGLLHEIVLVLG
jgi:hypothetical protein